MSTIQGPPLKMLGRFVSSVSLASVTRSASGLFTVDGVIAGDLHVSYSLKDFTYRILNDQVDQSPTDLFLKDNVAESGDIEVTITEQRLASYIPLTEQLAYAGYNYVRVQRNYLPPGATVPMIWLAILSIREADGGSIERGPSECSLTGTSCGISPYLGSASSGLPF